MTTKQYIKTILMGCALSATTACSLDTEPISQASELTEGSQTDTTTAVLKNREAALSQRTALYKLFKNRQEHMHLDYLLLGEAHADNAYGGTTGQETIPTETNALDAATGTMSRDWSRYLEDIAKANVLINGVEQLHKKGEVSDAEYRQWCAEGQIFRALMMFRMVRMWGSLPVITKVAQTITSDNIKEVYPTYFPPRSTTEECYHQIIEDLEYAELNAPDISSTDRTLMSKTVAQAFLCKVYAEKAVRDYDKVIAYAEKVRNTPGVALEKDFSTLWGWNAKTKDCMKRNTTEGILEIQWFPGAGNWESWMYGRCLEDYDNSFTWAKWVTPSRDLIRAFEAENDTLRKNCCGMTCLPIVFNRSYRTI